MKKLYLTLDIGGTFMKYGIIDENENFLYKDTMLTQGELGYQKIILNIKEIFYTLKTKFQISGISISTTSAINTETTQVLTPSISIIDYDKLNFREALKDLLVPISVENDVKCMALCEISFLQKKYSSILAITYGTGIGSALIISDKVYHGFLYSAGECGKMLIGKMSYESLSSINSLVDEAKKIYPTIENGIDVFKYYDQNDVKITAVIDCFYTHLAVGLANIIYLFNPEHIILGGGITNRGNLFLEEVKRYLNKNIMPYFQNKTSISLAITKNDAGMIGAFKFYKQIFIKKN